MSQSSETTDIGWATLYRVAGVAALLMAVFIPVQVIIFILWPPPATVIGWFNLFQSNSLIGLLDLDLLLIVDQIFMGLIFLALYVALRRVSPSLMTIALAFSMLGIAAYFASTVAFEMLSLSSQYAAATTEAQRTILLAAGQVMMASWQGTVFDVGYVIEGIALILVSVVMLRSDIFSKTTAYLGLLLGIMSLLPPTAGMIGMVFALGSLIPLEIWSIMVAMRLFQLAKA